MTPAPPTPKPQPPTPARVAGFVRYAALTLAANIFVILWGAYVRASGSGAGCGSHWPLCNGDVVPRAPSIQTLVELTHRATSGAALLMVLGLVVWAFRAFPRGHAAPVRLGAALSFLFIVVEALIGAGLVLFELVAHNASVARALWMAAHLVNTFLLLAVLTLTLWWAASGRGVRLRGQGALGWPLLAGAMGLLVLGASGGVTALGDTLYATVSEEERARQGLSPTVELLVNLRILHPLIALAVGTLVAGVALLVDRQHPSGPRTVFARGVIAVFVLQLLAGAVNVALAAPIWLQLVHLLLADAIWIIYVLLAAATLADAPVGEPAAQSVRQLRQQPV